MFRAALENDLNDVERIYDEIHSAEEKGFCTIGWERNVYPTRDTAEAAIKRQDLFVEEVNGKIVGAAIINKLQVDSYKQGTWSVNAPEDEVMVLHTLVISPSESGKGYGKAFVKFYEEYATSNGCKYLRMDTNERNTNARTMYRKLGYKEVGTIPTVFNGIPGVNLVLLEKVLQ